MNGKNRIFRVGLLPPEDEWDRLAKPLSRIPIYLDDASRLFVEA
jgi:hypothetical protein